MDLHKLRALADEVERARHHLTQLRTEARCLNLSGHQCTISVGVNVNGSDIRKQSFPVARLGGGEVGYSAVIVPGMQMVLLGIKKLYNGWIDDAERAVRDAETRLREAVRS